MEHVGHYHGHRSVVLNETRKKIIHILNGQVNKRRKNVFNIIRLKAQFARFVCRSWTL